ncbi:nucleoporin NUP159-like [Penaeus japonicus]|uniref:nucleoporin NUP159-like n=1 Tax=Penaeus japonicus TaxID=27405 RepID=UPI001C713E32|nr:nucleoporin NUP159-like [Penaeus japonicus]
MAIASSVRVCETNLIERVRQYPHLYDTRHKDYKDLRKCAVTWAEIARSLGCPEAWKAWRGAMADALRDVYVRNKKSVMVGDKEKRPRWRFFDQMQFLNSYIIHKPTDTDLYASKWMVAAADVETVLCEDDSAILSLPFEAHLQDEDDTCSSNPPHPPPSSISSDDRPHTPGVRVKEEAVEWVEEEIADAPELKLEVEEEEEEEDGDDEEEEEEEQQGEEEEDEEEEQGEERANNKDKKKKKKTKKKKKKGEEEEEEEEKEWMNGHYEDSMTVFFPLPGRKRRRHHTPAHSVGAPPPTHVKADSKDQPSSSCTSPSTTTSRLTIASDALLFPAPTPVDTPTPSAPSHSPCEEPQPPSRRRRAPAPSSQAFVPDEEEELFGRYVAAAIRKLSAKAKSLAKMKIQRVLFEIEEWDR